MHFQDFSAGRVHCGGMVVEPEFVQLAVAYVAYVVIFLLIFRLPSWLRRRRAAHRAQIPVETKAAASAEPVRPAPTQQAASASTPSSIATASPAQRSAPATAP